MKNLKTILFAFAAVLVFTSCNNVEKILPKGGTWTISEEVNKEYEDGVLTGETSESNTGTFTFNDDNTGTYDVDGDTGSFTWSYSKDNETVTITENGLGITYDVLESSKDEQKWFTSVEIEIFGVTAKTEQTLTLVKQ